MHAVNRRHVLIGLTAAVPALAPLVTRANTPAARCAVCEPCTYGWQCQSGYCIHELCAPARTPCKDDPETGRKNRLRLNFACNRKGNPVCCTQPGSHLKNKCKPYKAPIA